MADVVGASVVVVVVVVVIVVVEDGMVVEVASDVVVVLVVEVVVQVVVVAGFFFLGISHRESHWLTNTHLSPGSHSAVPVLSRSKQKRENDYLSSPDRGKHEDDTKEEAHLSILCRRTSGSFSEVRRAS